MEKIKELIVVEGQHDINRLHQFFDCDAIATHGLGLDEPTLSLIERLAENRTVLILTDPDHPGELIRQKLTERLGSCRQGFVEKSRAVGRRNVGIEYADKDALVQAIATAATFTAANSSLSWPDYLKLDIIGSQSRRQQVCRYFHLGPCNNKTLYKRLNMAGITYEMAREALHG